MTFDSRRRREAFIVGGLFLLYLALWIFLPKPSFWGLDNGFKFQGARAFAASGKIQIPYAGAEFDPPGEFRPIIFPFGVMKDGSQIPVFPALFQVLAGLLIAAFGKIGPFLLPLFGGWATLLAGWYMWVRHRERHDGRLFLLVLGLGSPLLFYSLTLWEHSSSMALVTFAVAVISRGRKGLEKPRTWEPVIAGVCIALAGGFRTEALLWAPIVMLFWSDTSRSWRAAGRFAVGFLAGCGMIGLINYWQSGNPLPLHVSSNLLARPLDSYSEMAITRAQNFYALLVEGFHSNLWSVLGAALLFSAGLWTGWRREKSMWMWIFAAVLAAGVGYLIGAMTAENKAAYMRNSGGLIWAAPCAVYSLAKFHGERRRFWRLLRLSAILFIAAVALFTPTVHGIHWGPRFILPIIPFLLILAATRAQRWWTHYPTTRPVTLLLVALSVVIQIYSFGVLFGVRRENAKLTRWAASTGSEPAITSMWWLAGDLSLLSDRSSWFVVERIDRIGLVVDAMRRRGEQVVNYFERPSYVDKEFWWSIGAEPFATEYFLEGDGRMRRVSLRIIRGP